MGDAERLILPGLGRTAYFAVTDGADGAVMPDTRKLALRYLSERHRTGQITEGTVRDQRHALHGFAEVAPKVSQVTRRAVLRWFDTQRHVAPATKRTRYSTVKCFVRWLFRKGHIKRDPCIDIEAPKVPRPARKVIPADQAEAIVSACEDITDLLIIAFGFDMGLRRAEQAGLEVGDVTFGENPTIVVRGKSGHARCLPIPAPTYSILCRYIDTRGVTAGPLIRLRRYPERGVKPVWIGRRFSELAYASGVKHAPRDGVSHHAMRRTLATRLWQLTGDAPLVAEVLGHDGLGSLKHYVNAADVERMRHALNGLAP